MTAQHGSKCHQTLTGTRQRISACRKRLRQTRATQRALKLEQDEAVLEATKILGLARGDGNPVDSDDILEGAGAYPSGASGRFTPEVDRRLKLRAR